MSRVASTTEMWMLLIVRMVTRVATPPPGERNVGEDVTKDEIEGDALESNFYLRQDRLRQTLCDYIIFDFPARYVRLLLMYIHDPSPFDQNTACHNVDERGVV